MTERAMSPDNLRITLASPYPMESPGGVQENVRALAKQFNEMGHKATIVAPTLPDAEPDPDPNIVHLGVARPIHVNGTHFQTALRPSSKVLDFLRHHPADILDSQESSINMVSLQLHFSPSYNFFTHHSHSKDRLFYQLWRPLRLVYGPLLTGRMAVSPVAREFAQKYFPGKYEIIPNGVDTHRFNPANPKLEEFTDGKQNILYVGRLEDRKGFGHLLEAYKALKTKNPNLRLIVVGDGPNKKMHEKQAEETADVCFQGKVDADVIPRYFASAHVFSSPALYGESQGIVNLEAQASGVPVVSGDNPGYRFAINSGHDGILIDPKNTAQYAKALGDVLDNEQLRQSLIDNGLQTAHAHDWSVIAQMKIDFYLRKIGERNKKASSS